MALIGICDRITATKTSTQPITSNNVMVSCKRSMPKIAANTDSMLMIRDAAVGSRFFCPMICRE